jgi:DNA-binding winged helix-turn-helix (wHTH) protein
VSGAHDFDIDTGGRRLLRGGNEVVLEPRTLAVILELTARPGVLVTRNQLLDAVWGHRHLTRSALNRVIACARRALGDDAESPRYIATVHGAGYRYIGPVPRTVSRCDEVPVPAAPLLFSSAPAVPTAAAATDPAPRAATGLGRVWYLDLASIERRAERLCALAALFGMAGTGAAGPNEHSQARARQRGQAEVMLPQHILIRLQRPSPQGD